MYSWWASFSDLINAKMPLSEWLRHHRERRAAMTAEERLREMY